MYCPHCRYKFEDDIKKCPFCDNPLIDSSPPIDSEEPFVQDQYLTDMEEWYENQYNPGYWAGNYHIPPYVKVLSQFDGKYKGIAAFIISVFVFGFVAESLLNEDLLANIPAIIAGAMFGIVLVWAGIQQIRK